MKSPGFSRAGTELLRATSVPPQEVGPVRSCWSFLCKYPPEKREEGWALRPALSLGGSRESELSPPFCLLLTLFFWFGGFGDWRGRTGLHSFFCHGICLKGKAIVLVPHSSGGQHLAEETRTNMSATVESRTRIIRE